MIVKFTSHRAREKLLGKGNPAGVTAFWSWNKPAKGGYYEVPDDWLPRVRAISGATVARDPGDLRKCW